MKLEEIEKKEFDEFALNHENATFMQNSFWGEIKSKNGWEYKLLGVKEKKKIIAECILLSKKTPVGKKMFYAPRGYLLDYSNLDLFEQFDKLITEYAKNNGGIFLKIDPYVMYHRRDKEGNIVERDMFNTFNMGVGMSVIVAKEDANKAVEILKANGEDAYILGELVESEDGVILC